MNESNQQTRAVIDRGASACGSSPRSFAKLLKLWAYNSATKSMEMNTEIPETWEEAAVLKEQFSVSFNEQENSPETLGRINEMCFLAKMKEGIALSYDSIAHSLTVNLSGDSADALSANAASYASGLLAIRRPYGLSLIQQGTNGPMPGR